MLPIGWDLLVIYNNRVHYRMCRWVESRQGGGGMTKREGEEQERKGGKGEEDETGGKLGREKEGRDKGKR